MQGLHPRESKRASKASYHTCTLRCLQKSGINKSASDDDHQELNADGIFSIDRSVIGSKYRRSRWYVGGRVDTSGHFFIVSNHKVFYDVAFRLSLGRFFGMSKKKFCFAKNAFVFYHNGPNRWDC